MLLYIMLHLLLPNMPVITMDALGTSNCYPLISFNTSRAAYTDVYEADAFIT